MPLNFPPDKLKSLFQKKPSLHDSRVAVNIRNNVFKREYGKKALLSFITSAFEGEESGITHTNKTECFIIAEILDELGYIVDVVNYNDQSADISNSYQLIIGFGEPIERILFKTENRNFRLILYRNGADHNFSDELALARTSKIFKERGLLLLDSTRIYPTPWKAQHFFADAIVHLGNEFVSDTYRKYSTKVISLDLFYFNIDMPSCEKKPFNEIKYNFLWFGSAGAVHKGLDLLVDFFYRNPELNLFIAGLSAREQNFLNAFSREMTAENITNLGFVKLDSPEFTELVSNCGAIITPSLSEGGAGATLNAIANGHFFPIVSENTGLDFQHEEIRINNLSIEGIKQAIEEFLDLSEEEYLQKTKRITSFIKHKHTIQNYRIKLKNSIENILNS